MHSLSKRPVMNTTGSTAGKKYSQEKKKPP
jgi:hypothetical protein